MICNMDCFNCIHDDCIRTEEQNINEQKYEWRRKNPEKVKEIRKRYYEKHKAIEKERRRLWYLKNKDKISTSHKSYRVENKIKCSQCENCKNILDTKGISCNLCLVSMRVINKSCKVSPIWCDKRKGEKVS